MICTVLDAETTGLEQEKGHRLIEVALFTFDFASRALLDKYVQRIDPERSIDAKAQEMHGIAYNELVGQPKWETVAPEVYRRMDEADVVIAHNKGFDLPFICLELARVGLDIPNCESFCTMEEGRWATFDGKSPKLQELCFALGVDYDPNKAHAAEYDVMKTAECLWAGIDRGFYKLPEVEKA